MLNYDGYAQPLVTEGTIRVGKDEAINLQWNVNERSKRAAKELFVLK